MPIIIINAIIASSFFILPPYNLVLQFYLVFRFTKFCFPKQLLVLFFLLALTQDSAILMLMQYGLLFISGDWQTTLLNHILTADHGKKIAVIENEVWF